MSRWRPRAALALLLVAIVLAGCGRYGPPIRPKRREPAPVAQPSAAPAEAPAPDGAAAEDEEEE